MSQNRKSLMRLVLQSNSTSLYYCWGDQWTPCFKEAHNFGSFNNVVEFLRDSKLQEVELVLIHESIGRINFVPYPLQRLLHAEPCSPQSSGRVELWQSAIAE